MFRAILDALAYPITCLDIKSPPVEESSPQSVVDSVIGLHSPILSPPASVHEPELEQEQVEIEIPKVDIEVSVEPESEEAIIPVVEEVVVPSPPPIIEAEVDDETLKPETIIELIEEATIPVFSPILSPPPSIKEESIKEEEIEYALEPLITTSTAQSDVETSLEFSTVAIGSVPVQFPVETLETKVEIESYGRLVRLLEKLRASKKKVLKEQAAGGKLMSSAGDAVKEIVIKFDVGESISTMEGLISLLSLCPSLQHLSTLDSSSAQLQESRFYGRNSKIYSIISTMTGLITLDCSNLNGIEYLKSLKFLPNLKSLSLNPGMITLPELKKLKFSATLTSLSLLLGSAPINLLLLEKLITKPKSFEALTLTYDYKRDIAARFTKTLSPLLGNLITLTLNDLNQETLDLTLLLTKANHLQILTLTPAIFSGFALCDSLLQLQEFNINIKTIQELNQIQEKIKEVDGKRKVMMNLLYNSTFRKGENQSRENWEEHSIFETSRALGFEVRLVVA